MRVGIFILSVLTVLSGTLSNKAEVISDANPLVMPQIGAHGLIVISPTVLEVTLINTKEKNPARVTTWDFVNDQFVATIPAPSQFSVTVNGTPVGVGSIGYKRRPLHAPERAGDLRIGNYLYLKLLKGIPEGATVEVKNTSGTLWSSSMQFVAKADGNRRSPVIHVNQVGYMPDYPKKAMVGYYLGSLGELTVPTQNGFDLLDARTGAIAYSGPLKLRLDTGFISIPKPYQQVYEADFSVYKTPGEYVLRVRGLGKSFPFRINDGITANFARTFALGLYHQRCGAPNDSPFTRHTHEKCHTALAEVPTMDASFAKVQQFLSTVTEDYALEPRHTAHRLQNVAASRYPIQKQGKVDVSGGHHDAGDYSKYTINSAGLVHFLVFAADSFAGVGALDNLGLPESGDGKSDLLQEAKWEADFLVKLQDNDGGFYFLVYPKNRRYENNVLPQNGDPQVVWPKTTTVTAAAVAALAEAGSSPLMRAQFPAEAAMYLQKAQLGWTFLMKAIASHGKDGSYQKITHYGDEFIHDDELAWAAAALYVATGDTQYEQKLFEFYPNPNDPKTRRWTWWKLFEGYGCAVRTYAFAARSGRLASSKLNASYLAKCEAEIIGTADDHTRFSKESAYGTSFPEPNKQYRSAGWYFSSERAFDVTVAYQLRAQPDYLETVVANVNYEAGSNPVDMTFITGIGAKRQRDIVHQYAWNDHRILPPAGLPLGNLQSSYGYLETYASAVGYRNELPSLSYPTDDGVDAPYAFYDGWTDMINTMTEFVVMDQARSLASLAFWMAQGTKKAQPWLPITGQIVGMDAGIQADAPATLTMTAPGIDLSEAQVIWEVRYLDPVLNNPATIIPIFTGDHWIEAEALLPDGRRIIAVSNFVATTSLKTPPNSYQSVPLAVTGDTTALYHFDNSLNDASGKRAAMTLRGNARIDGSNLGWMTTRTGAALRFLDLGDEARVQFPVSAFGINSGTTAVMLEAMIYVNEFKAFDRSVATLVSLNETWNAYLELLEDKYGGPFVKGGTTLSLTKPTLTAALTTKTWNHLSIAITKAGYVVKVNGLVLASVPSGDLGNWGRGQLATITLGNFDGWIDELSVRSINPATANSVSLMPLPPREGHFRLRVTGQPGTSYLIQASQNSTTWNNVGTVSLSSNSAEFVDPGNSTAFRLYRALKQ